MLLTDVVPLNSVCYMFRFSSKSMHKQLSAVDVLKCSMKLYFASASLFSACVVSVRVSDNYVIAGSMQELYTLSFHADGEVAFQ